MEEEINSTERRPIPFLPFGIQLQNIFTAEIIARRFPVDSSTFNITDTQVSLNIEGIGVNEEASQAQVIFNMQLIPANEPRLFEISFKLAGIFIYSHTYTSERVQTFLEQGSLSIMFPFARELILSLCTRLQLPPILLPMIQIASPTSQDETSEENLYQ